ncbi:MAG: hypothetical protein ACREQ9_03940 [Candidatus Binatia bacterium]
MSVTKRIKDGLRKIAANDPGLGVHLQRSIRTGTFCSYLPVMDLESPAGERQAPIAVSRATEERSGFGSGREA